MTFVVETFTAIENLEVLLVLACEEVRDLSTCVGPVEFGASKLSFICVCDDIKFLPTYNINRISDF